MSFDIIIGVSSALAGGGFIGFILKMLFNAITDLRSRKLDSEDFERFVISTTKELEAFHLDVRCINKRVGDTEVKVGRLEERTGMK